jgi:hypothetical protein
MSTLFTILLLITAANDTDLGTIKAGAPLKHTFTLHHAGCSGYEPRHAMTLTGFTASCGCTNHDFTAKTLQPGESTTLTVTINTLAQAAGPWAWSGTVATKLANGVISTIPLRLTGTLVREVTVHPAAIALTTDGGDVHREIKVTWTTPRPLTFDFSKEMSSSKFITVLPEIETRPQITFDLKIKADLPLGEHAERITLRTDHPDYPELVVPVTVRKVQPSPVAVAPEQVSLNADQMSVLVQVRGKDGKPVAIADCECAEKALAVTWSKTSGPVATIKVKLGADAPSKGTATIAVKLTEPALTTITVPVTWNRD